MEVLPPPTGNVISRYSDEKTVAKTGITLASAGLSTATHLSILTFGAAASATGIGLVIAGAALTVATMGMSANAAYKTYNHRSNLQAIYERRGCYACRAWPSYSIDHKEHAYIAETILPYIIDQKGKKLAKKVAGTVGLGALTSGYGMARNLYKRATGTLGQERGALASWLSLHFMTHNCGLAQSIVAELYSFEEMLWLLEKDTDTATPLLMRKMASS
jgi:hypothetical protein